MQPSAKGWARWAPGAHLGEVTLDPPFGECLGYQRHSPACRMDSLKEQRMIQGQPSGVGSQPQQEVSMDAKGQWRDGKKIEELGWGLGI